MTIRFLPTRGRRQRRAQASLFDGLTFLALSMFSIAFIFTALGTYGNAQQSLMSKVHVANYLQNAFKAIYYVDASTLSGVNCAGDSKYCPLDCRPLESWYGVTVAELLKRDLRDYDGTPGTGLDDLYGPADASGKLAARCAFKQMFKPFSDAGYAYFIEFRRIRGQGSDVVPQKGKSITNVQGITGCDMPVHPDKVVISAPFRVFKCTSNGQRQNPCQAEDFTISACLWPTQKLPTATPVPH